MANQLGGTQSEQDDRPDRMSGLDAPFARFFYIIAERVQSGPLLLSEHQKQKNYFRILPGMVARLGPAGELPFGVSLCWVLC
jgi:hypothetical protein